MKNSLLLLIGAGLMLAACSTLTPEKAYTEMCWAELRKNMPDCSVFKEGGATYIKDSRCVQGDNSRAILIGDGKGRWRVQTLPEPKPAAAPEPAKEPTP